MKSNYYYRKATIATHNSIRAKSRSFDYKSVDGRVYQVEREQGPLKIRKEVVFHNRCNEKISVSDIFRIEKWLSGNLVDPLEKYLSVNPGKARRISIQQEYDLATDPATGKTVGDEQHVFEVLCKKIPAAEAFKSYKKLLYSMRYGNAPCKVYSINDTKLGCMS